MDVEVADVNLCALHCELRNTEQLLMSLGLTAHRCGSLKECNLVLAEYGPETMVKDWIVVKLKEGQDTDVKKQYKNQIIFRCGVTIIQCSLQNHNM